MGLHASSSAAQWVVQAYGLVLAALVLVGGSLGDRFGRRRLFLAGIIVFHALLGRLRPLPGPFEQLIVARAVQGLGAAVLTPGSAGDNQCLVRGDERDRAIGTWSGFTSLTSAAGPVLGGVLIAAGSWRYAFFLNVPVGLLALVFTLRVPRKSRCRRGEEPPRLGWGGPRYSQSRRPCLRPRHRLDGRGFGRRGGDEAVDKASETESSEDRPRPSRGGSSPRRHRDF